MGTPWSGADSGLRIDPFTEPSIRSGLPRATRPGSARVQGGVHARRSNGRRTRSPSTEFGDRRDMRTAITTMHERVTTRSDPYARRPRAPKRRSRTSGSPSSASPRSSTRSTSLPSSKSSISRSVGRTSTPSWPRTRPTFWDTAPRGLEAAVARIRFVEPEAPELPLMPALIELVDTLAAASVEPAAAAPDATEPADAADAAQPRAESLQPSGPAPARAGGARTSGPDCWARCSSSLCWARSPRCSRASSVPRCPSGT